MRFRPLRCPLCAVSAFAIALLVAGHTTARSEAAIQGWRELGLGWLMLDRWASVFPWRAAGGAALATLAAMLAAERFGETRLRFLAPLHRVNAVFGHAGTAAVLLALALFLPRAAARWTQPVPPPGSPNLLFVLVDTWRADHAGFLGYAREVSPRLDELAARGVVFERAISPSGWTKPAVATLFTGLLPSQHLAVSVPVPGVPTRGISLPPPMTTLIEILRGRGWDTAMWSPNPNIVPHLGFAQGAAHFADYFNHPERTREHMPGRLDRMLPAVRRWLAAERDSDRPFCAYVHVMDPHYPYEAPAPVACTFDRSGLAFRLDGPTCDGYRDGTRDLANVTPERRQALVDAYDEELLFTDLHLGPFLAEVLAAHPDTVVVLAGDHGEEFLEHGGFGHASTLYEELVHVPLVLWAPDLAPARIPAQIPLVDVFPTLLELLGVAAHAPPGLQGTSLGPILAGAETADRLAPLESGGDQRPAWQWRGLSDGRYKLLRREEDLPTAKPVPPLGPEDRLLSRPAWFLFDLAADPGETKNLFATPEGEARARALFATMEERGWYVPPREVLRLRAVRTEAGADIDLLRDLGYAGEGGPGDGH
ncbi:MAG: sulfatase [Planctomycetota bacterium]